MKFVHCADVHLHPEHPKRMEALRTVCEKTEECDADLLVIAGDLFDTNSAATQLRPQVRSMFEEFSFPVLIVAGNHDEDAYGEGVMYGEKVSAISGDAVQAVDYGGISFVGLPFVRGRRASEVLESVKSESDKCRVLVAHASFFASDPRWASIPLALREEEPDEFAMVQEDIASQRATYVALGHWHQPTDPPLLLEDTQVAYAGSISPVSRKELGRRKIALVEAEKGEQAQVSFLRLEGVAYNLFESWFVVMGQEEKLLHEIEGFLNGEQADRMADLTLEVKGYLQSSEVEFQSRLRGLCSQQRDRWRSINPEFKAVRFGVGVRPAIEQFLQNMGTFEGLETAVIFSDAELLSIARDLLNNASDNLKVQALSYGLRAFEEVAGR